MKMTRSEQSDLLLPLFPLDMSMLKKSIGSLGLSLQFGCVSIRVKSSLALSRRICKYEFTAMGAAVNLVSRIKFAAQPMTVLVSEKTYPFIAPVFDCADLGPVSIKGIKEPMHVYQVHGPKAKPGQMRDSESCKAQWWGAKPNWRL